MLIAGSGLGTGILAIPYAAAKLGIYGMLMWLAVACTVSVLLHLLVADLAIHSADSTQLLGIFRQHLFAGPRGRLWTTLFFLVLAAVLFLNLTIYILVAADVLANLVPWSGPAVKILFYAFASLVVLLGIRVIGLGEKYAMLSMGLAVLYLSLLASRIAVRPWDFSFRDPARGVAFYALCLFSFSALFSVPQVVNHIRDRRQIRRAVIAGIGVNALVTLVFTLITLRGSVQITRVATIGLGQSLGLYSRIACALFVLLAMLTSYWSIALAQLEILREQTGLGRSGAWLIATLPTLFIAIVLPADYITTIQYAGGGVAVIIGCMVLPAYQRAVRSARAQLLLGPLGTSKALLVVLFLGYLVMAAASFIPIE